MDFPDELKMSLFRLYMPVLPRCCGVVVFFQKHKSYPIIQFVRKNQAQS